MERGAEEYTYVLPFLDQKEINAGEGFPLGISAAFDHITRDIDAANISPSINNKPSQSINDTLRIDITTHVNTGSVRLDAWVFYFLNGYDLVGGIENTPD